MRTPCVAGWHRTPRDCLCRPLLSVTYAMIFWQPFCLFQLRRSTHRNFSWRQKRGEITKLAARRNSCCQIGRPPFSRARSFVSESQKRRNYEASIKNRNISGIHAASGVRLIRATRQNRLRPQCKLWPTLGKRSRRRTRSWSTASRAL